MIFTMVAYLKLLQRCNEFAIFSFLIATEKDNEVFDFPAEEVKRF